MPQFNPIVYVRGYAGTQGDVEDSVDDPTYGFNSGSTHIRLGQDGRADFFMFVSPFARLFRDYGYQDVIDGAIQQLPPKFEKPERTIWIYRYYDPSSQTFDRPGGRRLTIEEAALGLRTFIDELRTQIFEAEKEAASLRGSDPIGIGRRKVLLVAHSMGGLVCRCLLQKVYPVGTAREYVDKLFTYGTPHGGIHFDGATGKAAERLVNLVGYNDSDNFGAKRMYEFLTRKPSKVVPKGFDSRDISSQDFNPDRIFCVIGTNADDYAVGAGIARNLVGPQSDGLVQVTSAYVRSSHRAYIHRSHSGRYGMVNSEEGYQNLQRFLFWNVKIKAQLVNFAFDFPSNSDLTYFLETHVAIRGLPVLVQERTLQHYCAEAIDKSLYDERFRGDQNELPLFTNFLLERLGVNGSMRYMIRLAVFSQKYRDGFFIFGDHIERLPLWSDYVIVELTRSSSNESRNGFEATYCWASEADQPTKKIEYERTESGDTVVMRINFTGPKVASILGTSAVLRFEASKWE